MLSKKMEIPFRGTTSTQEFNEFINNTHSDLMELYAENLACKVAIEDFTENIAIENKLLVEKILEIENASTNKETKNTISFFNPNSLVDSSNAKIDTTYGILTANTTDSVSKVLLKGVSGVPLVPSSLDVKVYEAQTLEELKPENLSNSVATNLANAFSPNPNNIWKRKVTGKGKYTYAAIKIVLPPNIINHMRVNCLKLIPFPSFSMSLVDVQYRGAGSWTRLATYPTELVDGFNKPVEIQKISPIKFIFPAQDMTELLIYIKQNSYEEEPGVDTILYGFKHIGVEYLRFNDSVNTEAVFEIKHPMANKLFNKIIDIDVSHTDTSIDPGDISLLLFKDRDCFNEIALGEALLATNTIYAKLTFSCSSKVSPMFDKLTLEYESITI